MAKFIKLSSTLILALIGFSTLTALSNPSSPGDDVPEVSESRFPPNQNLPTCEVPMGNGTCRCAPSLSTCPSNSAPPPDNCAPAPNCPPPVYKCCPDDYPNTAVTPECCYGGTSAENYCPRGFKRNGQCGIPT